MAKRGRSDRDAKVVMEEERVAVEGTKRGKNVEGGFTNDVMICDGRWGRGVWLWKMSLFIIDF